MSTTMKSIFSAISLRTALLSAFALAVAPLFSQASLLSSGVNLGYSNQTLTERWAVFALDNGPGANVMSSGANIWGDVAFAGTGNSNLSGYGSIRGDVVSSSSGSMARSSTFAISGGILNNQNSDLMQGVANAHTASNFASGLTATSGYPTTINQNTSLMLSGAANQTVVLQLTDFVLSDTAALTLQGTATTTYVINVTNKFSLSGSSVVQLSGGLTYDNVLFNVVGAGTAATMSGSSVLNGILLATDRTAKLSGSATVYGEVIADKVSLAGVSSVQRPVSP